MREDGGFDLRMSLEFSKYLNSDYGHKEFSIVSFVLPFRQGDLGLLDNYKYSVGLRGERERRGSPIVRAHGYHHWDWQGR